ncbi:MAG TPA: tungstate ABC transporter substrate-binding protein WtpA [Bacteroidales bacterium]|nr:tungstate ABC transporter substrate-binding protein WtpA [Bacteroidales bacterium]
MRKIFILFISVFISGMMFAQPVSSNLSGDLIIFHAGSLSVPVKEVVSAFNKIYPNVKVLTESAGSLASARKITDLNRPCDIMISADYAVIDKLLIPKYTDWNIKFASNELSIVYSDKSRMSERINAKNWYKLLQEKDVAFGRADPNADPCGYRSVLMLQLAEKYYKVPGLAGKILAKDQNYIRPKEVDLLALLESGNIDYLFLYRSVAIQHNLKYIILPDEINLKSMKFADNYATASTSISGSEPGKKDVVKGEPMIYGFTILKNAPNMAAAIAFAQFLLSKDKGMKIMEKNGQPSVIPMSNANYNKLPQPLKSFAKAL